MLLGFNFAFCLILHAFALSVDFFENQLIEKNLSGNTIRVFVKQFGYRSGPMFCQA